MSRLRGSEWLRSRFNLDLLRSNLSTFGCLRPGSEKTSTARASPYANGGSEVEKLSLLGIFSCTLTRPTYFEYILREYLSALSGVIGLTAANLAVFQIVGQTDMCFYYPWQLTGERSRASTRLGGFWL